MIWIGLAGGAVAVQPALNAGVSRATNSLPAALASFIVGAGALVTITGQLTGAVVADRLGILGLEQTPITADRLLGVALLVAGTYLVVR